MPAELIMKENQDIKTPVVNKLDSFQTDAEENSEIPKSRTEEKEVLQSKSVQQEVNIDTE